MSNVFFPPFIYILYTNLKHTKEYIKKYNLCSIVLNIFIPIPHLRRQQYILKT